MRSRALGLLLFNKNHKIALRLWRSPRSSIGMQGLRYHAGRIAPMMEFWLCHCLPIHLTPFQLRPFSPLRCYKLEKSHTNLQSTLLEKSVDRQYNVKIRCSFLRSSGPSIISALLFWAISLWIPVSCIVKTTLYRATNAINWNTKISTRGAIMRSNQPDGSGDDEVSGNVESVREVLMGFQDMTTAHGIHHVYQSRGELWFNVVVRWNVLRN